MPRPDTKPIRLLLVDDHQVLRLGLRTLFAEAGGFRVEGETGTKAAAVTEAARHQARCRVDGRPAPRRQRNRSLSRDPGGAS